MATRRRKPPAPPAPPKTSKKPSYLADPQLYQLLINAVTAGMSFNRAAEVAGIDVRLLRAWMARGRASIDVMMQRDEAGIDDDEWAPDEPYHTFVVDLTRAEARGELALVAKVSKASEKEWRAAAWLLERKWPSSYAAPARIELSGNADRPLQFVPAEQHQQDPEQVAAEVISALAGAGLLPADLASVVDDTTDDDG